MGRTLRLLGLGAILVLALTACPADDDVAVDPVDETDDDVEEPVEEVDEEDTAEPAAVEFDIGVTEEPCPNGVNDDNGCIYLGTLSDLTVGPFAAFGDQILQGQEAFWQRVNEQGGIGGQFDVEMGQHVEDTEYNPEVHVSAYQRIVGDVLALTQTLGTPPTLAIIEQMTADDVVGAPLSWWSGWEFPEYRNVLQAGSNYCIDAMNGVEWAVDEYGVETVMTVHFPGDYGGDGTAGVSIAAEALGLELVEEYQQVQIVAGGETSGAIQAILTNDPDLVVLTIGPSETAEIVGGAAAQGFEGRFIGSHPTYDSALLGTPAGPAILGLMNIIAPHQNWGADTEGHQAMQEQFGEGAQPGNDGFTYGWVAAYPLLSVLEHAHGQGDLTRANVRAAVEEVTVDFEGILPDVGYEGDPNEIVLRSTAISRPAEVPERLGLETIEERFEGSVAADFEFTEPCQPIN